MGVMQGCCWVAESIVSIVSYIFSFIKVGCARAWMREAPWYVPCASATCILCREFAICAYVSTC